MRKFATVTVSDPIFSTEQEALFTWPAQPYYAPHIAAAIAAQSLASSLHDIEAMILSGDDGATPYWFMPPYATLEDSARDAVLTGSDDADILRGREGADLLFGLEGDDILQDVRGNNLFDGGAGADIIEGAGRSLYIGGAGNDSITAWGDEFTIAFDAGDGFDSLMLCARGPATISLGLGVSAAALAMAREGANLVIRTSATEGMALAGWYGSAAPEALTLQFIGANGTQACDPMALLAALGDGDTARLGATALHDADTAGGELAATYALNPRGIDITGASAAIWLDGFGLVTGLGALL